MPIGTFKAQVLSHRTGTSIEKGTQFVAVQFVYEHCGTMHEIWGRIWRSKKPQGQRIARKSLKAIGFDPTDPNFPAHLVDEGHCMDNECEIQIEREEYKGKGREVVAWINPISERLGMDAIEAFAADIVAAGSEDPDDEGGPEHVDPDGAPGESL